jgi:formamidopyrimidine-DNA glycosylase
MNPLVRRRHAPLIQSPLKQALFRQLGDIYVASELTRISVREISTVHQITAAFVAATLREAQQIMASATQAGNMTPQKEARLRAETEAYLTRMLEISNAGSQQMTQLLFASSVRR